AEETLSRRAPARAGRRRPPDAVKGSAEQLLSLLSREALDVTWSRLAAVSATAASSSSPMAAFAVPPLLQPALTSPPLPLPSQVLVDLLKHPLCVSQARRLV